MPRPNWKRHSPMAIGSSSAGSRVAGCTGCHTGPKRSGWPDRSNRAIAITVRVSAARTTAYTSRRYSGLKLKRQWPSVRALPTSPLPKICRYPKTPLGHLANGSGTLCGVSEFFLFWCISRFDHRGSGNGPSRAGLGRAMARRRSAVALPGTSAGSIEGRSIIEQGLDRIWPGTRPPSPPLQGG